MMNLELPDLPWTDKVAYLAWKISQNGGIHPGEIEVKHIFREGLYIREMTLPADFIFIGRVHKKGHVVELLEGSANLITAKGTNTFHAVDRINTPAGFQTVAVTLTPCLARTVHENPSNSRNVDELELAFFEPAEPMFERGAKIMQELLVCQV